HRARALSIQEIRSAASGSGGNSPAEWCWARLGRKDLLPHRKRSRWRSSARKMLCKLKVTHPLRRPKSGFPIFFFLDKTETTDKVRLNQFNFRRTPRCLRMKNVYEVLRQK